MLDFHTVCVLFVSLHQSSNKKMKKEHQAIYVSPQVEAVEIKSFGVLCASVSNPVMTDDEEDVF